MATTKIEWADSVWNPITGCSPISEGCDHCYARRMATRLKGRYGYDSKKPFEITEHPDKFKDPCRTKKPTRFFVCSMGDLFHEDVNFNTIAKILWYARADECKKHTFLFLTKRPERMLDFFFAYAKVEKLKHHIKNFWIGVTAENQQRADERIPILLQIPAAVRFVSIEPMLTEIDMRVVPCGSCNHPGDVLHWPCPYCKGRRFEWPDWVIAGGETGPAARPIHADWVRQLRDQCVAARVPFFFKGFGGARKNPLNRIIDGREWNEAP